MDHRELSLARKAAFEILRQVARGKADPGSLLHGRPTHGLKTVDHELATEIVYGVLRWQNLLDYVLQAHSKRALAQLDLPVLLALRIGAYQIRRLNRVPARAAVDESVKLARVYGPQGAHGFVNAVLRGICRKPEIPSLPSKQEDPLRFFSITLSHPEWLARRTMSRLGLGNTESRFRYYNQPPPIDLRVEPPLNLDEARAALEEVGVSTRPFPLLPRCLRVLSGKVAGSPPHRAGAVFIQEAGSQLIPYLLGLNAGDRVLDACAAPGAKATEMSRWNLPGPVIALEYRRRRLAVMASLSKSLGCSNLLPVGGDAARPPFHKSFSHILLDAPCSSLGTLARNPDIKWRIEERDLRVHAKEQGRLLDSCAGLLALGGKLVYSTCSTEPEENEEVIRHFLNRHGGFRTAAPPPSFPRQSRGLVSAKGRLITCPERDEMDGYFAVVLQKIAD